MQTSIWKNLIRFVFLILLQGMVLEHIDLPGNLHCMVYPIAILLLPLQTSAVVVLLLGFVSGLCVDVLCQVPGLNAAAATLMAFVRVVYFRVKNRRESGRDNDLSGTPLPAQMGWGGFVSYTLWTTLLFHLSYFMIDAFSFRNIFYTLYLTVGSTLVCFVCVILTITVFKPKASPR
ncbi:MAG: hypothetical protein NC324_04450 [Bacteroides sp.]|nr:hypothetical protein [Bacteroides sp.]MCM1085941.1 hypothetical protein [Bacteroides sp.]MCM1169167.1 hypothetical protein [Bacteroides sp.]